MTTKFPAIKIFLRLETAGPFIPLNIKHVGYQHTTSLECHKGFPGERLNFIYTLIYGRQFVSIFKQTRQKHA